MQNRTQQEILRCKQCQHPLGIHDHAALTVGSVRFLLSVTMQCLLCRHTVKWRPAEQSQKRLVTKDVASVANPA